LFVALLDVGSFPRGVRANYFPVCDLFVYIEYVQLILSSEVTYFVSQGVTSKLNSTLSVPLLTAL
jgi:hypothetical protein